MVIWIVLFDFPEIHDVINYDMHDDIENYVHRIGRTGRGKNTWVATTMISNKVEMAMLADISADRGSYCGGLGHIIMTCSKLEAVQNKKAGEVGKKDYLANNAMGY